MLSAVVLKRLAQTEKNVCCTNISKRKNITINLINWESTLAHVSVCC